MVAREGIKSIDLHVDGVIASSEVTLCKDVLACQGCQCEIHRTCPSEERRILNLFFVCAPCLSLSIVCEEKYLL